MNGNNLLVILALNGQVAALLKSNGNILWSTSLPGMMGDRFVTISADDDYVKYHHVLGHNLLFGVVVSAILAVFSVHRAKAFWLYLGLFHLHLVLDYFGSGSGWGIHYLWPFSSLEILNPDAWNFFSWQNLCAAAGFLVWTIAIISRCGRTPLEFIMLSLDRQIVRLFQRTP